jgi:hypothetical protein
MRMRKILVLTAVTALSAAALTGLTAESAAAAGCASWSATASTLTVHNVCGPAHTQRAFTPHIHVGGAPANLACKSILAGSSATWSLSSRVTVDSVPDTAHC